MNGIEIFIGIDLILPAVGALLSNTIRQIQTTVGRHHFSSASCSPHFYLLSQ